MSFLKLVSFVIILVLQVIGGSVHAQESTLWMRDGKKITISNFGIDSDDYYNAEIIYLMKKGKIKKKYLDEVFSVVDSEGNERILYEPNFELGEVLTQLEMKQFVLGLHESDEFKMSPIVGIGGVLSGLAGAFVPQLGLEKGDSKIEIPIGILVPSMYVGVIGATSPSAETLKNKMPAKANNEHYLMGYQEGIRKKRYKQGLIGAGIGFVTGIILVATVN